jgi:small subunit ribosomal protein S17
MPKRVLIGTVVSDKADKTVTVRVDRRVKHPLYGKIIRRSKKYHAHDADNAFRTGEQVRIEECKPISKHKSWTVIERLGAAKAAVIEIDEPDVVAPTAPAAEEPTKEKAEKPAKEKSEKAEKPAKEKTEKKPAKPSKGKGKAKAEDVAEADAEA